MISLRGFVPTDVARAAGFTRQQLSNFTRAGFGMSPERQAVLFEMFGIGAGTLKPGIHRWNHVDPNLANLKRAMNLLFSSSELSEFHFIKTSNANPKSAILMGQIDKRYICILAEHSISLKRVTPILPGAGFAGFGVSEFRTLEIDQKEWRKWMRSTLADKSIIGALKTFIEDTDAEVAATIKDESEINPVYEYNNLYKKALARGMNEIEILSRVQDALGLK